MKSRLLIPRLLLLMLAASGTHTSPAAPSSDLVDLEFRKLLVTDESALQQVDRLIADNQAFIRQGAGLPESSMVIKIRNVADPVVAAYEAFLKKHPEHVRGHLAFASFLTEFGVSVRAQNHLDKALALAPDDPVTLNNVANYHGEHGPPEKAFEYLQKAIRLKPEESTYYRNCASIILLHREQARTYFGLADEQATFRHAQALYRKAHERKPDDFLLASDLAQTFYHLKPHPYEEAVAAWETAFKLAPSRTEKEGVMVHLARIHSKAGEYDEARRNLNGISIPELLPTKRKMLAGFPAKMKQVNFDSKAKRPILFNVTTAPPKLTPKR